MGMLKPFCSFFFTCEDEVDDRYSDFFLNRSKLGFEGPPNLVSVYLQPTGRSATYNLGHADHQSYVVTSNISHVDF